MPTVTGPWLQGDDLTTLTVQGGTLTAAGVFTAGTTYNLQNSVLMRGHQLRRDLESIRPSTSIQHNMVVTGEGNAAQIRCLKKSDDAQSMHLLVQTYTHARIIWVEGHDQFDGYYLIGQLDDPYEGQGQQVMTVDFEPIALSGASQVTRTTV